MLKIFYGLDLAPHLEWVNESIDVWLALQSQLGNSIGHRPVISFGQRASFPMAVGSSNSNEYAELGRGDRRVRVEMCDVGYLEVELGDGYWIAKDRESGDGVFAIELLPEVEEQLWVAWLESKQIPDAV
jgi:hypothetical protein